MPTVGEVYRLTRKLPDLPWNLYVCRPIAAVVVQRLEGTRVTPNQITFASFVVAAIAAVLLVVLPGRWGVATAVVVFEGSYVLDCADGMLARLRRQQSTEGHLIDFLMDEIKAFAILAAASIRLWLDHGRDERYLLVGIFGLVSLASGVALTTFLRRPEIEGASAKASAASPAGGGSPLRAVVGYVERIAKFLIHYPSYVWLVALLGRLDWYLLPYVGVNALYAFRTLASVALRFGRSNA